MEDERRISAANFKSEGAQSTEQKRHSIIAERTAGRKIPKATSEAKDRRVNLLARHFAFKLQSHQGPEETRQKMTEYWEQKFASNPEGLEAKRAEIESKRENGIHLHRLAVQRVETDALQQAYDTSSPKLQKRLEKPLRAAYYKEEGHLLRHSADSDTWTPRDRGGLWVENSDEKGFGYKAISSAHTGGSTEVMGTGNEIVHLETTRGGAQLDPSPLKEDGPGLGKYEALKERYKHLNYDKTKIINRLIGPALQRRRRAKALEGRYEHMTKADKKRLGTSAVAGAVWNVISGTYVDQLRGRVHVTAGDVADKAFKLQDRVLKTVRDTTFGSTEMPKVRGDTAKTGLKIKTPTETISADFGKGRKLVMRNHKAHDQVPHSFVGASTKNQSSAENTKKAERDRVSEQLGKRSEIAKALAPDSLGRRQKISWGLSQALNRLKGRKG